MLTISTPPGRQMPISPAMAPIMPRNFSPTRTAMLVAFKPGRLWLIDSSTNSLSSIQCRFVTRLRWRYGTDAAETRRSYDQKLEEDLENRDFSLHGGGTGCGLQWGARRWPKVLATYWSSACTSLHVWKATTPASYI